MPSDWRHMKSIKERSESKYSADLDIVRLLDASPFVVSDWTQASASVVVLVARVFGGPVVATERCRRKLMRNSAAWRATNGSRHFFILTNDRGPCCNDGTVLHTQFLRHHIAGHHAEIPGHHWRYETEVPGRIGCFHAYKDISIPTPTQRSIPPELPGRTRDLLFFFAGAGRTTTDFHVYRGLREGRRFLLATYFNSSHKDVLVSPALSSVEYKGAMQRSKFCLIMGGYAPWTPRLVEILMAGCIPVIFSSWLLPFSNLIDWSRCSVRVPNLVHLPKLRQILEVQDYERLAAGVAAARHALWYDSGAYNGGGMLPFFVAEMHIVLVEAARRPLQSRVHELLGTAEGPGPLQSTVFDAHKNLTMWRNGQTAILTNRSGKVRKWECSLRIGGRPMHVRDPDEVYEPRNSTALGPFDHTYTSDVLCSCRRVRGAPNDEPISPTQRILSKKSCTNLSAAPTSSDNCTRYYGSPAGLDRWLTSSNKLDVLAVHPFSSTNCMAEPWCLRNKGR